MKKPRLFYWEETEDCWAPVPFPGEEVPGMISVDGLFSDQEEHEIRFKRIDMTDEQMEALPTV